MVVVGAHQWNVYGKKKWRMHCIHICTDVFKQDIYHTFCSRRAGCLDSNRTCFSRIECGHTCNGPSSAVHVAVAVHIIFFWDTWAHSSTAIVLDQLLWDGVRICQLQQNGELPVLYDLKYTMHLEMNHRSRAVYALWPLQYVNYSKWIWTPLPAVYSVVTLEANCFFCNIIIGL